VAILRTRLGLVRPRQLASTAQTESVALRGIDRRRRLQHRVHLFIGQCDLVDMAGKKFEKDQKCVCVTRSNDAVTIGRT